MALVNRQFGWDLPAGAEISIAGINVTGIYTSVSLRIEADTMEARAVHDTVASTGGINNGAILGWAFPRIRSRSWTMDFEGVIDGTDGADLLGEALTNTGEVEVTMQTANLVFAGDGVFSGGGLDLPGEAASQSISLTGSGLPSVSLNAGDS